MASDSSGHTSTSCTRSQKGAPDCPLLGNLESSFRREFLLAAEEGRPSKNLLLFVGKVNLPTREQVVKLYIILRRLPGNYRLDKEVVAQIVAKHIMMYWRMANFSTSVVDIVGKRVLTEISCYQKLKKNTRKTEVEKKKKDKYVADLKMLFDIASKDLENRLKKDRLLVDQTLPLEKRELKLKEDLEFLRDQRGPRLGSIGCKDTVYTHKVEKKENRLDREAALQSQWKEEVKEKEATQRGVEEKAIE